MYIQWNENHQFFSAHELLNSIKFILVFLMVTHSFSVVAADNELLNDIQTLESEFNVISSEFFNDEANYTKISKQTFNDIKLLLDQVDNLSNQKQYSEAIQLIFHNLSLVEDNLDHPAIVELMQLLLERNEINLANKLYKTIKRDGDDFQFATVEFLYANFHAKRFNWLQVKKRLENTLADLSEEHSAYALLLMGTALQHLKQHREAGEHYQKIQVDSKYYQHAQLNLALTQIRQGWLTNARDTIKKLIINKQHKIDNEFTNRLYLVLGYALLQKNYFRDSAEVFRKISQTSQYANRALLGLALCAINQDDLQSGLNTLFLLKNKKSLELSVDESFLLISYIYEKFEQKAEVVTSSTEAINYYQRQIGQLESMSSRPVNFSQLQVDENHPVLLIQNHDLEYARQFPDSFLINYRQLLEFSKLNSSPHFSEKIELTKSTFDAVFQSIIQTLIQQKISYLKNYLNQARYGLARFYDNNARQP